MAEKKVKRGDWVRFMANARLVIGQVEYTKLSIAGSREVYTDAGMTYADSILETRASHTEDRG